MTICSVIPRGKIEQTNRALEEKMNSKVDELKNQLNNLKSLLEKIDKATGEKHECAHVEEVTVDLVN